MANLFLERYVGGEHRPVWKDLLSLGAKLRTQPYYADALAVAAETMKRARHNVESIVFKLGKLGYKFTDEPWDRPLTGLFMGREVPIGTLGSIIDRVTSLPVDDGPLREAIDRLRQSRTANKPEVYSPSGKNAAAELDFYEDDFGGPLPIALRAWYEHLGSVNLMGHHELLNPLDGGTVFADPLVVFALAKAAEGDFGDEVAADEITLALSARDKAHARGGRPYTMVVPNAAVDGELAGFRQDDEVTLVEYLRLVFEYGGFPGWEACESAPRAEIDYLKQDLLPI